MMLIAISEIFMSSNQNIELLCYLEIYSLICLYFLSLHRYQIGFFLDSPLLLSLCKLIRLAGLCCMYKTCFNQICILVCPFYNANVRITVSKLRDIPADMILDKVV